MTISVCTILYHSSEVLDTYFGSLANVLSTEDEVLIYDNAPESRDEFKIRELAQKYGMTVRYWSGAENVGFARGCNFLASHARGSRLVFLNPDTETLSFDGKTHKASRVYGAIILRPSGDLEGTFGRGRSLWDEAKLRWLRKSAPRPDGKGYVSGAALSVSKDAFDSVGGFDEAFFMYFEDIDLCFRLNQAGRDVCLDENWVITHVGGSSARKIKAISAERSLQSSLYFHRKWGHSVVLYRLFSILDAGLRVLYWASRRDADSVRVYKLLISLLLGGKPQA